MAQLTPEEIEAARKSYAGVAGTRAAKTLREAAKSASAWLAERKPSVNFSERWDKAKDYVKPKVVPGLAGAFATLESYQNIDRNKGFYDDDKVGLWDKAKQVARDVGEPVLQGGLTVGGTVVGAGLGGVMAPVGFGAGVGAAMLSDKLIDDDGRALTQWKQAQPKPAPKAAPKAVPEKKGYDLAVIESLKSTDGKPRSYTPEQKRQIRAYIADVAAKEALKQQRAEEEALKVQQREDLEALADMGDKWAERRLKRLDKEEEARTKKADENLKFSEQKAYAEMYHKDNESMFLNGLDERARGKQADILARLKSGELSQDEADEAQAALEAVKRSQDWLHGTTRLVEQKQHALDNTQWDRAGLGALGGALLTGAGAAYAARKGKFKPLKTLLYSGTGGLAGGAGGLYYGGGSEGITEDTDLFAIEQMQADESGDGISSKEMYIPQGLITPQYGLDLRRRPPPQ
jgi:hypothetical protein